MLNVKDSLLFSLFSSSYTLSASLPVLSVLLCLQAAPLVCCSEDVGTSHTASRSSCTQDPQHSSAALAGCPVDSHNILSHDIRIAYKKLDIHDSYLKFNLSFSTHLKALHGTSFLRDDAVLPQNQNGRGNDDDDDHMPFLTALVTML